MLGWLTLILCCQLAGELARLATGLPVPGPVIGMVLLFAGLMIKGAVPDGLGKVADGLLAHLSLMFVPAGVGVVLHLELMGEQSLALSVALVGSTLAAVAVTALVMVMLKRGRADADDAP